MGPIPRGAFSQGSVPMASAEKQMAQYLRQIKNATHDDERELYNGWFSDALLTAIRRPGSFDYPFDSLKAITTVTSPDKAFRLYTWNLPTHEGKQKFFGFIQVAEKADRPGTVITLTEQTDTVPDLPDFQFRPDNWYGAVYYSIIPETLKSGEIVYTLLGWHGISREVSSRLIDVLTFTADGAVRFGLSVFCTEDQKHPQRLVFRYSASATMVLNYEEQSVQKVKKWNPSSRQFEELTRKVWMIVCDRLLPSDPQMKGQYEYYLPASDVMDGFIFENGCWTPVKDIDARNPATKPKKLLKGPDQK